jgi:hypothetical protein
LPAPTPPTTPAKSPASVPSNTLTLIPEPSKSVPSASDSADTGSSVKEYAVNAVLCVVALAVIVGGYAVYRFFNPKIEKIPAPKLAGTITSEQVEQLKQQQEQLGSRFSNYCWLYHKDSISYTWHLFKKKTERYYYGDMFRNEVDGKVFYSVVSYNTPLYDYCKGLYIYCQSALSQ